MGLMLTEFELAEMRATQESTMVDRCIISSQTTVPDGAGSQTITWVASAPIPCRRSGPTRAEREQVIATRATVTAVHVVTVPVGVGVATSDRITVGNLTLEVVSVPDHTNQTAVRVLCVEHS